MIIFLNLHPTIVLVMSIAVIIIIRQQFDDVNSLQSPCSSKSQNFFLNTRIEESIVK